MEIFETLISLLVIGIAIYTSFKKKKMQKAAAFIRKGGMPVPSDYQTDMQPAPVPRIVAGTGGIKAEKAETKQAAFPSGFVSRPEATVIPEGVDPCHDEMYPVLAAENAPEYPKDDGSKIQSGLVQGVVWAEILGAPKCRRHAGK